MNIQIFDKAEYRYRLGDLVLLGNDALKLVMDPESPFHNTIGYDYATFSLERNRFLNFKLLKELIKVHTQKHQYPMPPSDVLVMHYRAGDRKRVNSSEIEDLSSYIKNACVKSHLTKVQIVTAFHYENMLGRDEVDELSKENYRNLERLVSIIENMGMTVSIKSSGGIDEDFCFISNAKHLLPTKGGYSILAGLCNPHKVYPTFHNTTATIRHYAKKGPVSLSMNDLLFFLKMTFNKKKHNPVLRLLRGMKPGAKS
ncbi:MAG: hypothetical protein V4727_00810 [Verrucomicrobiota bacterium]